MPRLTTAVNYAVSGLVDWPVAPLFIVGGIVGGWIGARIAKRLSAQRQTLTRLLGCMLVVVSAYMLCGASHSGASVRYGAIGAGPTETRLVLNCLAGLQRLA